MMRRGFVTLTTLCVAVATLATTTSCGDDGLTRTTRSRLEVSTSSLRFEESPRPGFRTETPPVTISNGGDQAYNFTGFELILDTTGYISVKGNLPDVTDDFERRMDPDDAINVVFALQVPAPAESDVPLTCPEAPSDLPSEIDTSSYCGHLTILTNATDNKTATVYLLVDRQSGNLSVMPDVLTFDNPQPGRTLRQTMTLMNTAPAGALEVTQFIKRDFTAGTSDAFAIEGFPTPLTIEAGSSATYEVVYRAESAEDVSGTIEVQSTGGNVNVSVQANAMGSTPQIEVSPTSLVFPNASPGNPETLPISISNNGIGALVISDMSIVPPASADAYSTSFTGQVTIPRGQSMMFDVTYDPPSADSVGGTLRIRSNAGNVPNGEVEVTLSGSAASPNGDVSPTEVVFDVAPGESDRRSIVISNEGLADLSISGYEFSGDTAGEFSLDPDPSGMSVGPGELLSVDVVYNRQANDIGMDVSNLILMTNNPFADGELITLVRNASMENSFSPVARIVPSPDGSVTIDTAVALDGSTSTAESGTIDIFAWLVLERPPASSAVLTTELGETTSITPDVPGTYRVQLTVRNSLGLEGSVVEEITATE